MTNIPRMEELTAKAKMGNSMACAIKKKLEVNFFNHECRPKRPVVHRKKHRKWPSLKATLDTYSKKLCREHEKETIEEMVDDLSKGKEKVEIQSAGNPQGDEDESCSIDLGPAIDFEF